MNIIFFLASLKIILKMLYLSESKQILYLISHHMMLETCFIHRSVQICGCS